MAELLPAGALWVAALDVEQPSGAQLAAEQRTRQAPTVGSKEGCQVASHEMAAAGYRGGRFALAMRGGFRPDAMLACLSRVLGGTPTRRQVDGRELLIVTTPRSTTEWLASVDGGGLLLGASAQVMPRVLADDFDPAIRDPRLAPLVARARAGGELWAAAALPADGAPAFVGLRRMLGLPLQGRIRAIVASVHITASQRIDVSIDMDGQVAASQLAVALDAGRRELRGRVGPGLGAILDAITIRSHGPRIAIVGVPPKVDWLQVLRDALALVAELRAR